MDTIFNQFPDYQPDQLLTSDNLNQTTDFVEQQERLTRFGFTQNGVISGLSYWVSILENNNISAVAISNGFAADVDGFFMQHNFAAGYQDYTMVKPYAFQNGVKDIDFNYLSAPPFTETGIGSTIDSDAVVAWELLPAGSTDTSGDIIPLSKAAIAASNVIVALFLEVTDSDQSSCSPGTCDDNGKEIVYRVVPMLIKNTNALFPAINSYPVTQNYIRVSRMFNIKSLKFNFADTTTTTVNARPFATYDTLFFETNRLNTSNKNYLSGVLTNTLLNINSPASAPGLFGTNISYRDVSIFNNIPVPYAPSDDYPVSTAQYQANTGLTLDIGHPFVEYENNYYNELAQVNVETTPPCPFACQYVFDFNGELELAVNEFLRQYNLFNTNYFTTYPGRKRRFVVLGSAVQVPQDLYRYYPLNSYQNAQMQKDEAVLTKLYQRIWTMVKKFSDKYDAIYGTLSETAYSNAAAIKVIPSRLGPSKLGERAIPFYYNADDELKQAWSAGTNEPPFSSDTNNPDINNIFNYYGISNTDNFMGHNINEYDFFRIEGVLGCNINEAKQNLINQMRTLNIQMSILPLEWTEFLRINQLLFGINTFYARLVTVSKTAPTALISPINAILSLVANNMLNINAFWNQNMVSFSSLLQSQVSQLSTLTDHILNSTWVKANISDIANELSTYTAPPPTEGYTFSELDLIYTFDGMEHIGGVRKGGTYILVYIALGSAEHKVVVADFQLPNTLTCTGILDPLTPNIQQCPYNNAPITEFVNNMGIYYANFFSDVQVMFNDYRDLAVAPPDIYDELKRPKTKKAVTKAPAAKKAAPKKAPRKK